MPGTRSSERSLPPKIFVMGDSVVMAPEERVIAAFCLRPTSSHSSAFAADGADASLMLGRTPFVGVEAPDVEVWSFIARLHSSCISSRMKPKNSSASC